MLQVGSDADFFISSSFPPFLSERQIRLVLFTVCGKRQIGPRGRIVGGLQSAFAEWPWMACLIDFCISEQPRRNSLSLIFHVRSLCDNGRKMPSFISAERRC